jgi:hypothetical protein
MTNMKANHIKIMHLTAKYRFYRLTEPKMHLQHEGFI